MINMLRSLKEKGQHERTEENVSRDGNSQKVGMLEIKNCDRNEECLDGLTSTLDTTKERISEFEDRSTETSLN